ncbi:MAG TPA: STAS/SEC14 domain-containing protein [Intrasporangium sp.]|uniref:STAS/SEC14 domain-containing protein n=1 Tax=Intrasporangium sp. TaxID=1925024 RepID=UPI002D772413|nr:STAS/SEC14 domain-containing protein [Intrasporangium sp.]HET7397000.1 STAS/SEC14 domain-containing protein [Intrasporangium sp.]
MNAEGKRYRVTWDEASGIARTDWLPGAVCGIEEAHAVDAEIKALGRGKVRCLVDLRQAAGFDRPAREFFISQNPNYRAVALVAGSAPTRMLANFFIGLKRGTIPVKMFTSEADAVEWLQAQA